MRSLAAGAVFPGKPTSAEEKRTRLIVRELDTDREGDWGNLRGVGDLVSDRFASKTAGAALPRELRSTVGSLLQPMAAVRNPANSRAAIRLPVYSSMAVRRKAKKAKQLGEDELRWVDETKNKERCDADAVDDG